jgi:hypothetical protein
MRRKSIPTLFGPVYIVADRVSVPVPREGQRKGQRKGRGRGGTASDAGRE